DRDAVSAGIRQSASVPMTARPPTPPALRRDQIVRRGRGEKLALVGIRTLVDRPVRSYDFTALSWGANKRETASGTVAGDRADCDRDPSAAGAGRLPSLQSILAA